MTDEEIIRKAVELAEGWLIHDLVAFSTPDSGSDAPIDDIKNMTQMEKDALAAQLVRQVDALEKYDLVSHRDWVHIEDETIPDNGNGLDIIIERPERGLSGDRTMNTLRAIVESKVLE